MVCQRFASVVGTVDCFVPACSCDLEGRHPAGQAPLKMAGLQTRDQRSVAAELRRRRVVAAHWPVVALKRQIAPCRCCVGQSPTVGRASSIRASGCVLGVARTAHPLWYFPPSRFQLHRSVFASQIGCLVLYLVRRPTLPGIHGRIPLLIRCCGNEADDSRCHVFVLRLHLHEFQN